jgi:secreted trypsin-like serine protease
MKVLAIVLLAAVAIQAAPRSGLKDPLTRYPIYQQLFGNVDEKIINGVQVNDEKKHPHQVWILMDNSYFCGGSIVAANKVLTAAHCVDGFRSFKITAGDVNRLTNSPNNAEQTTTATIDNVVINPKWNTNTLEGDLAVITLTQPFNLNEFVNKITLEGKDQTVNHHAGEVATISGYGKTSDNGGVSQVLNEIDNVPVITNEVCASAYGINGAAIANAGVICLDSNNGGSCNGDSGGPLSQIVNGVRQHIGIVSFGSSRGCSAAPIGFSRTAYYRDWIDQNVPL